MRASAANQTASSRLPTEIAIGVVLGLTEAFFAVSLGGLIFSGRLADHLSIGIGMALIAGSAALVLTSILASASPAIGSLQDGPNVLIAVVAGSLAASVSDPDQLLVTVLLAMIAATLLTAGILLLLGVFRWGGLVRYIPYPVVGGFLAGTGWLLVRGALDILAGPVQLASLPALLDPQRLLLWLPGVLFAVALFAALRRINHFLTLPAMLLGGLGAFYLALWVTGIDLAQATERGLLLGGAGGSIWRPPNLLGLGTPDWGALVGQIGNIGAVLGISLISLLLNASSLELVLKRDLDINRELRAAGVVNLASGIAGGMVGFLSIGLSALAVRGGARSRWPGVIGGLVVLVVLLIGYAAIAYFPKALLGGLLFTLGLDFLDEWVVRSWKRFTRAEYGVVLLILVVIAATDFLVGVGVGLAAMIVHFVISYSRVDVMRHKLSGAELRSNVERNALEQRALARGGEAIYLLELRGHLFFGTAVSILDRIRARVEEAGRPAVRFILLDFKHVTGVDASTALTFLKAEQLARERGISLCLTDMPAAVRLRLEQAGLAAESPALRHFADLDRGLEWCEEQLLQADGEIAGALPDDLCDQLCLLGFEEAFAERLPPYLEPLEIPAGGYLMRRGEASDCLYYIEDGRVSVLLERDGAEPLRLRTIRRGATVGEMGFYTGSVRTASVVAEVSVRVQRLTLSSVAAMTAREPDLSASFHRWIARLLAERLAAATRSVEALQAR